MLWRFVTNCTADMYHGEKCSNSVRKSDLDTDICDVLLMLNHGINYVLITLICCPYLKTEDISMGYFRQAPSLVARRHRLIRLRPGTHSSTLDCKISEGEGCSSVELLAQIVGMRDDSIPCMGTRLCDPPEQVSRQE